MINNTTRDRKRQAYFERAYNSKREGTVTETADTTYGDEKCQN